MKVHFEIVNEKPETHKWWVYVHTTPDGMNYVGVSSQEKTWMRWKPAHYKKNSLEPYINQFGWDAIEHTVVAYVDDEKLALLYEDALIKEFAKQGTLINKQGSGGHARDNIKEYQREYHQSERGKAAKRKAQAKYYEENKDEILKRDRKYREEHKEEIRKRERNYREEHKEEIRKSRREYYEEHKDEILKQKREYHQSERGKAVQRKASAKYKQSSKGKAVQRKANAKRNAKPEWKIYNRVSAFNRLHPDLAIETPLEAKTKYLETGYIPTYIKHDDLE